MALSNGPSMIAVGLRYSLAWKHPHRIEAVPIELTQDHVLCEVEHRCPPTCPLLQMRQALPIEGRMKYDYAAFATMFVPMAEDAIALGTTKS